MKCNKTLLFLIGCIVIFLLVGAVSATDKNTPTANIEIDGICQTNSCINPQDTHVEDNHVIGIATPQNIPILKSLHCEKINPNNPQNTPIKPLHCEKINPNNPQKTIL